MRLPLKVKIFLWLVFTSLISSFALSFVWAYAIVPATSGQTLQAQAAEYAALIVISTAFLAFAAIIITKSLLKPLRELEAGAYRIGRGEFTYRIPRNTNDELGRLARAFNDMGTSLGVFTNHIKHENESLVAEQAKIQAVLASVSDGVIALKNDTIAFVNPAAARLIGQRPELLVGASFTEAYPLVKDGKPISIASIATGKTIENAAMRIGARNIYLNVTAVQLSGDPSGLQQILTLHDLSSNRELDAMKLDFVSMAAHELRTPLTAIRGYLDLITRFRSKLPESEQTYLQRASISAADLVGLVNNLLNVSKIERGAMTMAREKLDWAELVAGLVTDQKVVAAEKEISVEYSGPLSGIYVYGDRLALREVIGNLVSNAIHYTNSLGRVTIHVEKQGKDVLTRVTDTGQGIPDTAIAHLFTKFYRVGGALESGSKGTGLGLYISKSIIDLHDGTIGVHSQEGIGTEFYFTLPAFDSGRYDQGVGIPARKKEKIHG